VDETRGFHPLPTFGESAQSSEPPRARARRRALIGEGDLAVWVGVDDPIDEGDELGECSGCECSRARCAALGPPAIKCCPDCAHPPLLLNLEWILRGPLLEAIAAIRWKPLEAQREGLEEPEKSREAAA
jgi:hypothetical protein